MAYGSVAVDTINTSTGVFQTNNAYTGIAKAWVNFVGSTGVINASLNVSSVTRTATGVYTITFSTAMQDTYYSVSGMTNSITGDASRPVVPIATTYNTGSVIVYTAGTYDNNTYVDCSVVSIQVFR